MIEKMKSRKFWMGVFGALAPILFAAYQGRVPTYQELMISTAAIIAYLIAEGFADGMGGTVG